MGPFNFLVQQHAANFVAHAEASTRAERPQFTEDEFDPFLESGILAHEFLGCAAGTTATTNGWSSAANAGDEARTLQPRPAVAINYPIAFRPRAGQKMLTRRGAMPRETTAPRPRCADIDGFSLHAAVRVEAHDRQRLEPPCRHITRPALSDERVQRCAAGQGASKLKTRWRGGTLHLVTNPLQFMQRLARVPVR